MKKFVIHISFLFFAANSFGVQAFAQNFAETFHNVIPQAASISDTAKGQLSARLAQLAAIHPDLLYHYLTFLNLQFMQPGSSQAVASHRRFLAFEKHYKLRRQDWVKRQISVLSQQEAPQEIMQLAQRHFEGLYLESETPDPDELQDSAIDTSKLNYLVVQYYQWNKNIPYQAGSDYLSQRRLLEEKLRAEFARKKANLSAIPRLSHHELIQKVLSYWHLYEGPFLGSQDSTFASDFVLALEQHYYSLRDVPNDLIKPPLLAVAGGFYQNNAYRFTSRLPIVELNRELLLDKRTKFSQNMLSLQWRWPLRKYLTAFSFLNLQLGYLNSKADQYFTFNNLIERGWFVKDTTTKITTYYQETTKFTTGKSSINLRKSYLGRLNAPIIVVNKHIWFEAGISISRNYLAYKVQYNYRYKLIETKRFPNGNQITSVLKDGASGNREQNKTLTQWSISPNLGCVIQLPYRLILEGSFFERYATVMASFTLF